MAGNRVVPHVANVGRPVAIRPASVPQGDTENRTGMWLAADLGDKPVDILPLKTRLWATQESVTGGVALKCFFEPGSKAAVNFEMEVKPPVGSAGVTFYAKASRPLRLAVQKAVAEVGTEWKKIDLPWASLGTIGEKRDMGHLFTIRVAEPIRERTWLILDRLGTEKPDFIANPKINPQSGLDQTISSQDILYGAEYLSKTLQRARSKQPFTIYAFGNSITLGARCTAAHGIFAATLAHRSYSTTIWPDCGKGILATRAFAWCMAGRRARSRSGTWTTSAISCARPRPTTCSSSTCGAARRPNGKRT